MFHPGSQHHLVDDRAAEAWMRQYRRESAELNGEPIPCDDCDGDGWIVRLIQKQPLNQLRRETCSYCGGSGSQADADWRIENAEAAEEIARAELTSRCNTGDLHAEFCAWLGTDTAAIACSADEEGYIAFLIRSSSAVWTAAFERGFTALRAGATS